MTLEIPDTLIQELQKLWRDEGFDIPETKEEILGHVIDILQVEVDRRQ